MDNPSEKPDGQVTPDATKRPDTGYTANQADNAHADNANQADSADADKTGTADGAPEGSDSEPRTKSRKKKDGSLGRSLSHIFRLGVKELQGLRRDWILLVLIAYSFTFAIYTAATAMPDGISKATIGIVDEDDSPLSRRIAMAFYPPMFLPPVPISIQEMDSGMDQDLYTFTLDIPPNFQRDVLYGKARTSN
ncbi:MAG: hypothetical protein LUG50_14360 [Planctomycetaceae bacterium]|nr:hypothetical protein [Planctomycetaceae bacterium]